MNSKTRKELNRITESIPKELLDNLVVEKPMAPSVIEVFERGSKDKRVDTEMQEKMKNVLDAGYLNYTEKVTDEKVEKKIDRYVSKEIDKAVKLGRIPDPKKDEDLKNYHKKVWKKAKKSKRQS